MTSAAFSIGANVDLTAIPYILRFDFGVMDTNTIAYEDTFYNSAKLSLT